MGFQRMAVLFLNPEQMQILLTLGKSFTLSDPWELPELIVKTPLEGWPQVFPVPFDLNPDRLRRVGRLISTDDLIRVLYAYVFNQEEMNFLRDNIRFGPEHSRQFFLRDQVPVSGVTEEVFLAWEMYNSLS